MNKKVVPSLLARDGNTCFYCGKVLVEDFTTIQETGQYRDAMSVDHKTPLSKGGTNDLGNLVLACRGCNGAKRARTLEEYRVRISPTHHLQKIMDSLAMIIEDGHTGENDLRYALALIQKHLHDDLCVFAGEIKPLSDYEVSSG